MMDQLNESSYMRDMAEDNAPSLIPVHVSSEEKTYFDYMQGGESVDPSTGMPEYSKLSEVMRNPEVRDLFADLTHMVNSGQDIPPEIMEFVNEEDPYKEGIPQQQPAQENSPLARQMEAAGEMDHPQDNLIVLLPQDIAEFFDELKGGAEKDPIYGLEEFGFFSGIGNAFKSIVRVGATIAGAFMGGPMGAAAGNMLGRAVTGQKIGSDMLSAGLQNGLYAYGAGAGLSAMGGSFGALGGAAGAGSGLGNMLSGAASKGAAAAPGAIPTYQGWGTVGETSKLVTPQSQGLGGMSSLFGGGDGNSLFSGVGSLSSLFPQALQIGGAMLSQKGAKEDLKSYNQLRAEQQNRMQGQLAPFNQPLGERMNYQQPFINTTGGGIGAYKKGGKIVSESYEGAAKGQDDTLKKTAKEGDFIWTATDVGHLGDGNSKAGFKEIKRFEKDLSKELPKKLTVEHEGLAHGGKPRDVKCLFSDGEHRTDRRLVSHLGEGDNDKGADILKEIREELRKDKISKDTDLPPKSKGLDYYYKKVIAKR